VLSDAGKRAEYDRGGFVGVAGYAPEDLFRGANFEDLFGGLNFGFGGDLFERFFGRQRAGPPRGENIEVNLRVPLERVARGGEEDVRFARTLTCPACHGSGSRPGTAPRECSACRGTGEERVETRKDNIAMYRIKPCPVCNGRGQFNDNPCAECSGLGEVRREERLKVSIPIGVEDGMALRVAGMGQPSREPGGQPGDLYVVVQTAADSLFERSGADLWRIETVGIPDAVLGATLRVPTLEKPVELRIAPGTQPGAVLRLRGKGLPHFGARRRGDLYIRLQVRVPERLTATQRELYERLRTQPGAENAEARQRRDDGARRPA
jgi:molecular chaperone DnaJ